MIRPADIPTGSTSADMKAREAVIAKIIGIGIAKLTVGVKQTSGKKVQYCITAIA